MLWDSTYSRFTTAASCRPGVFDSQGGSGDQPADCRLVHWADRLRLLGELELRARAHALDQVIGHPADVLLGHQGLDEQQPQVNFDGVPQRQPIHDDLGCHQRFFSLSKSLRASSSSSSSGSSTSTGGRLTSSERTSTTRGLFSPSCNAASWRLATRAMVSKKVLASSSGSVRVKPWTRPSSFNAA